MGLQSVWIWGRGFRKRGVCRLCRTNQLFNIPLGKNKKKSTSLQENATFFTNKTQFVAAIYVKFIMSSRWDPVAKKYSRIHRLSPSFHLFQLKHSSIRPLDHRSATFYLYDLLFVSLFSSWVQVIYHSYQPIYKSIFSLASPIGSN